LIYTQQTIKLLLKRIVTYPKQLYKGYMYKSAILLLLYSDVFYLKYTDYCI